MDVCGVKSLWSEYSALMSDDRVLVAFSSHEVVSLIAMFCINRVTRYVFQLSPVSLSGLPDMDRSKLLETGCL